MVLHISLSQASSSFPICSCRTSHPVPRSSSRSHRPAVEAARHYAAISCCQAKRTVVALTQQSLGVTGWNLTGNVLTVQFATTTTGDKLDVEVQATLANNATVASGGTPASVSTSPRSRASRSLHQAKGLGRLLRWRTCRRQYQRPRTGRPLAGPGGGLTEALCLSMGDPELRAHGHRHDDRRAL